MVAYLGGVESAIGVEETLASLHVEVQVRLRGDMVEPFLPGLVGEVTHWDMGELAVFIFAC